jgi:hypothetical protein
MMVYRLGPAWLGVLAVGAVLLTVGAGLCLFDGAHGDADEHGMSVDLCLGLLVVSVGVPLLAGLPETGCSLSIALSGVVTVVPLVPAPPPKFAATL